MEDINYLRKDKLVLSTFLLLAAISIAASYYRYFILEEFVIQAEKDCDPSTEKCFIRECDVTSGECTGDDLQDTTYYKVVERKAKNIPLCNPNDDSSCHALICGTNEADCTIIYCDETTSVKEDAACSIASSDTGSENDIGINEAVGSDVESK